MGLKSECTKRMIFLLPAILLVCTSSLWCVVVPTNPYTSDSPVQLVFIHNTQTSFHIAKHGQPNEKLTTAAVAFNQGTYSAVADIIVSAAPGKNIQIRLTRSNTQLRINSQSSSPISYSWEVRDINGINKVSRPAIDISVDLSATTTSVWNNTTFCSIYIKLDANSYLAAGAGNYSDTIFVEMVGA